MKHFTLISAASEPHMGIGYKNSLPWKLKNEMKYFSDTTCQAPQGHFNICIMGRKSWDAIPPKYRPLKERKNVVLSRSNDLLKSLPEDVLLYHSMDEAKNSIEKASWYHQVHRIFVIGGSQIYAEALKNSNTKEILLTYIHQHFECDAFFPTFSTLPKMSMNNMESLTDEPELGLWRQTKLQNNDIEPDQKENGVTYTFTRYEKVM